MVFVFKLLCVALLAAAGSSLVEASERGKELYASCVDCHGSEAQGNKLLKAPALSGLSTRYMVDQLGKFKVGHRGGDLKDVTGLQMRPMAMLLQSEADQLAVAEYIASLEARPQARTLDGGDVEKGKVTYMICQACHGADGKGVEEQNGPSLLNQHDWYHLSQLKKFKDGTRGSHPADETGLQMRPMAMILLDEQAMKDVIAYIQSLSE